MSPYRTIEVSDPAFECDHLRTITIRSEALRMRGDISLFVPPTDNASVPLLVLLHGVYGSHWAWTMKGGAHRSALRLMSENRLRPLAIVMPSDGLWADGSGYLPHHGAESCSRESEANAADIAGMEDVIDACQEAIPLVDDRSPVFLSGFSMGGYGALRLGSKYAARVSGISAHSSITDLEQMRHFVDEQLDGYADAGDENADVLFWMRKNRACLPPIRFDCGNADLLVEDNRRLHRNMVAEGIAHRYEEYPGGHTWQYWQEHVEETLLFVETTLGRRLIPDVRTDATENLGKV